jgi:hypothetical protein
MRIGDHSLGEHIRLLVPLFVFIAGVWALRLLLHELAVLHALVHVLSITVATALALLFVVVLIHVRGFGSYPSVVVSTVLVVAWAQLLIVLAIIFSVVTGTENIFTLPEFSMPGDDPRHIRHILGHLTFALGGGALIGSAFGCLILWMLRRVLPEPGRT